VEGLNDSGKSSYGAPDDDIAVRTARTRRATPSASAIRVLGVVQMLTMIPLIGLLSMAGSGAVTIEPGPPMQALLFFDDWMLQMRQGFDRMQGHPALLADITPDLPKGLTMARGTWMLFDEKSGRYVMYIDCQTTGPKPTRFNVRVESDDPCNWPQLRGDASATTLNPKGDNVVVDENGKPLSRFTITSLAGTPLADKGYVLTFETSLAYSKDGIHCWMEPNKVWKKWGSDTWNGVVWDPIRKQFQIFGRPHGCDRRVARVTTTDFETFSPPEVVFQPDAEDPVGREFYGMANWRYEDMQIGLLSVYDTEATEKSIIKWQGSTEMQLTYSYDGDHWYRAFRDAFIARGEPGTQTGGAVYLGTPVRTPDNRLLFPGMAAWGDHAAYTESAEWGRGFFSTLIYQLRLDGFAYLRTRGRLGLIRTKALIPEGDEITLNVRTTRSGFAKVQVLDAGNFQPIPGYTLADAVPVTGDYLFAKARWKEHDNIAELKGKPIILDVQVREGELYAVRLPFKAFYSGWVSHRL